MAQFEYLFDAAGAIGAVGGVLLHDGQDGVVYGLEGLRDQGGADRPRGVAAAQCQ